MAQEMVPMDFHEATAALSGGLRSPATPVAVLDVTLSLKPPADEEAIAIRPSSRRGARKKAKPRNAGVKCTGPPPTNTKPTVPALKGYQAPKMPKLVGDDPVELEMAAARLYHTKHVDKLSRAPKSGPSRDQWAASHAALEAQCAYYDAIAEAQHEGARADVPNAPLAQFVPTVTVSEPRAFMQELGEWRAKKAKGAPDTPVLDRYNKL